MKGSGGKANPKLANELLKRELHRHDAQTGFGRSLEPGPVSRPLLVYLAAAVVDDVAARPASARAARRAVGPGDPYLNLWILGWDMQAVLVDPASLFTGRVFDANIFHPAAGTLAYSDHLLLQSLLLSPLYAITHDVVLCYNVLLIASLVASALAMHLFVRSVVSHGERARISPVSPGDSDRTAFAHLIHLQLQSLYFLPLTFLFLHRVIAGRRVRDVVLLGVVPRTAGDLVGVLRRDRRPRARRRRRRARGRRRTLAQQRCAAPSVLRRRDRGRRSSLPIAIDVRRVAQREGFGRNLYEAGRNAAYASSYLQVPPGNVLYGRTGLLRRHDTP